MRVTITIHVDKDESASDALQLRLRIREQISYLNPIPPTIIEMDYASEYGQVGHM